MTILGVAIAVSVVAAIAALFWTEHRDRKKMLDKIEREKGMPG